MSPQHLFPRVALDRGSRKCRHLDVPGQLAGRRLGLGEWRSSRLLVTPHRVQLQALLHGQRSAENAEQVHAFRAAGRAAPRLPSPGHHGGRHLFQPILAPRQLQNHVLRIDVAWISVDMLNGLFQRPRLQGRLLSRPASALTSQRQRHDRCCRGPKSDASEHGPFSLDRTHCVAAKRSTAEMRKRRGGQCEPLLKSPCLPRRPAYCWTRVRTTQEEGKRKTEKWADRKMRGKITNRDYSGGTTDHTDFTEKSRVRSNHGKTDCRKSLLTFFITSRVMVS